MCESLTSLDRNCDWTEKWTGPARGPTRRPTSTLLFSRYGSMIPDINPGEESGGRRTDSEAPQRHTHTHTHPVLDPEGTWVWIWFGIVAVDPKLNLFRQAASECSAPWRTRVGVM